MFDVKDPKDAINKILDIANSYACYDKEGYGYYLEMVDTWEEFLKSEIEASSGNIKEYIENEQFVYSCLMF